MKARCGCGTTITWARNACAAIANGPWSCGHATRTSYANGLVWTSDPWSNGDGDGDDDDDDDDGGGGGGGAAAAGTGGLPRACEASASAHQCSKNAFAWACRRTTSAPLFKPGQRKKGVESRGRKWFLRI
jgi:hypothetical protein